MTDPTPDPPSGREDGRHYISTEDQAHTSTDTAAALLFDAMTTEGSGFIPPDARCVRCGGYDVVLETGVDPGEEKEVCWVVCEGCGSRVRWSAGEVAEVERVTGEEGGEK